VEQQRQRRLALGLALIAVGGGLWAVRRLGEPGSGAVFLGVGGVLLLLYLVGQAKGTLIPGCILLGLGAAAYLGDRLAMIGDPWMLGLGAGFLAIPAISWMRERRAPWWPLVPGGILLLLGTDRAEGLIHWSFSNWPLALVVAGVALVVAALVRSQT